MDLREGSKIYAELINSLDKNGIGMPASFPLHGVFWISLKCFAEATLCFDKGAYEASTVMCRDAIDSCIIEAALKRKNEDNTIDWDLRILFGTKQNWFEEYIKSDNHTKNLLRHFALKEIKKIQWAKLSDILINKLKLLSRNEAKELYKIREAGNFSAHLGNGVIEEYIKSLDKGDPFRMFTSSTEANNTLEETGKWLEIMIERYFKMQNKPLSEPK